MPLHYTHTLVCSYLESCNSLFKCQRRLYSWLLSDDSNTNERMCQSAGELSPQPGRDSTTGDAEPSNYFDTYSRGVLIQALCNCLKVIFFCAHVH